MDGGDWGLVRKIFDAACDLERSRLARYLDRACVGRPDLRQEVESLLAAHRQSSGVLDEPVAPGVGLLIRRLGDAVAPGEEASPAAGAFDPAEAGGRSPLTPDGMAGPFEIRNEIGRGGMGVVYEAWDRALDRPVAIKRLREDRPDLLDRFKREARIQARLEHPSIAPVHHVGEGADGLPYFAMRLVRGKRLDEIIRSEVPRAEKLHIFLKVCDALAYAHSQGFINRDPKPHNIIVGEYGMVHVVDWGLARPVQEATAGCEAEAGARGAVSASNMTRDGTVAGTPEYMAPEQADGDVDKHNEMTDIYLLGGVLYEILTGFPPHGDVESPAEPSTARQPISRDPVWPADRCPEKGIPRELDAVVRRAMARDQTERYQSVAALADDVTAFLDHRMLAAADYPPLARAAKWVKRNPVTSGLLLLLGVAIGAGLTVSHYQRTRALAATAWARFDQATALEESGRILDARRVLDRLEREDRRRAVSALAVATARWSLLRHGAGTEISSLQAHDGHLNAAAFLPDGRRAVSAGDDGAIRIWEVRTGLLLRALQEDDRPVLSIALSADGRRLLAASATGDVRLWDMDKGDVIARFRGHPRKTSFPIALSPDGDVALCEVADNCSAIFDATSGRLVTELPCRGGPFAVDATGRYFAAGAPDSEEFMVGELASGRLLRTLGTNLGPRFVTFLPDGSGIVVGSEDTSIRVWGLDGRFTQSLEGHRRGVKSGAVSADGRLLLSGSFDRTMRLWDLTTGRPLRQFVGHDEQVSAVAFSPDGGIALSGGWDGKLLFWSLGADLLLEPEIGGASGCAAAGLSGSGRDVLTDDGRGGYSIWDLDTRREILHVDRPLKGPGRILRTPRASFGLGTDGEGVVLRELASGRCVWRAAVGLHDVFLVPSPEGGRSIWVQDGRGVLHRIDPDGGHELEQLELPPGAPPGRPFERGYAFSPDGRRALTRYGDRFDGTIELWDVRRRCAIWAYPRRSDWSAMAFSPDGREALLGSRSKGSAVLVDAATGRDIRNFPDAPGRDIREIMFFPDDRHAVLVSGSGPVLLDLQVGREIRDLPGHKLGTERVAMLPGGRGFLAWLPFQDVRVYDFSLPERRRALADRVNEARKRLAVAPGDAAALNAFGLHYAERGLHEWSVEFFDRAVAHGGEVDRETYARSLWLSGHADLAAPIYRRLLAEVADDDVRFHLEMVLLAVERESRERPRRARPPSGS